MEALWEEEGGSRVWVGRYCLRIDAQRALARWKDDEHVKGRQTQAQGKEQQMSARDQLAVQESANQRVNGSTIPRQGGSSKPSHTHSHTPLPTG